MLANCLLNASAFSLSVTFSLLLNVMLLLVCVRDFLFDSFVIVCHSLREFLLSMVSRCSFYLSVLYCVM